MRFLTALLLPILAPLFVVAINRPVVSDVTSIVTRQQPSGLLWGDKVHTSQEEFERFLRSRGRTYEAWAANHPGAAPWRARFRDVLTAWVVATCLAFFLTSSWRPRPRLPVGVWRRRPQTTPQSPNVRPRDDRPGPSAVGATAVTAGRVRRKLSEGGHTRQEVGWYFVAMAAAVGMGILIIAMMTSSGRTW